MLRIEEELFQCGDTTIENLRMSVRLNVSQLASSSNSLQPKINVSDGKFSFTEIAESKKVRKKTATKSGDMATQQSLLTSSVQEESAPSTSTCLEQGATSANSACCPEAHKWQQRYMDLEKRFSTLESEVEALKQVRGVKEVKSHFQYLYKQDTKHGSVVKNLQYKLELLSNTVVRFEQKLKESNDKIVNMQVRSMRRNVIISGLHEPKNESKDQLLNSVKEFLQNTLEFPQDLPLEAFHQLGYVDGSGYHPTFIKLADLDQKIPLLACGPKLKGKKNDKQRFYYISEQLPDQMQEERKYAQFWISDNRKKPAQEQKQMKIHKNKLYLNAKP